AVQLIHYCDLFQLGVVYATQCGEIPVLKLGVIVEESDDVSDCRLSYRKCEDAVSRVGRQDVIAKAIGQQGQGLILFRRLHLLDTIFIEQRLVLRRITPSQGLCFHQVLDLQDAVENLFGPRRTSGDINIDGNNPVDAMEYAIRVENATDACTSSDRHNPSRFGHLLVHLPKDGAHLFGDRSQYHQQICLARRKTQPFRAETRQVVMRAHGSHESDAAAGSRERPRPDGILTGKPHHLFEAGGKKASAFHTGGFFRKTDLSTCFAHRPFGFYHYILRFIPSCHDPDATATCPSARRTGNPPTERQQTPSFQQSPEYPCRGNSPPTDT